MTRPIITLAQSAAPLMAEIAALPGIPASQPDMAALIASAVAQAMATAMPMMMQAIGNANVPMQSVAVPSHRAAMTKQANTMLKAKRGRRSNAKSAEKLASYTANAAKNADAAVKLFTDLGYSPCIPYGSPGANILAGGKWIALGYRPISGKGQRIAGKPYTLWHAKDVTKA